MQRLLTRTDPSVGTPAALRGQALIEDAARIASIVRSRLGHDHATLLASPKRLADGQIEWSTGAQGDIVELASLPEDSRQALLQRAERLAGDIRGLADAMRAEGSTAAMVGEMLALAVQWPNGNWIYSVGGKPVAVMWGHLDASSAVPTNSAGAAASDDAVRLAGSTAAQAGVRVLPVADADLVDAAAVRMGLGAAVADEGADPLGGQPTPQAVARRRWAVGLASALLALLFLGVLYTAMTHYLGLQKREQERQAELASLAAANASLEAQIARKRAVTSQMVCVAAPAPPPVQAAAAPEPVAEPAKPAPAKLADVKNMCPGERPKELAPELAIVFDASGSMSYSLDASDQEIRAASARDEQLPAANLLRGLMGQPLMAPSGMASVTREPTRMTSARQAALAVVKRAPSDAGIGLVLIEQCANARSLGYFPPGRRAELTENLQRVRPVQGTPLADGVAQGGRMLNGVKRDSLMVVISDGVESCGGDPCAVAAALAKSKPRLKINVVDITGTGAGNCLAKATGGKVFTARNAGEVAAMTARAAQDVMAPANCKKP